jgi:uncharacterized membrane protein
MDPIILTILLSMSPVSELRGGIPYALSQGFSIYETYFLCVLANILIAVFIMVFLTFLHESFMKLNVYRKTFDYFLERARKRSKEVEKSMGTWGYFALCIFVAIPLPMTGAWTGTLIAWLLGLNKVKSMTAIALGVAIAGIIVTLVALGAISFLKFIL